MAASVGHGLQGRLRLLRMEASALGRRNRREVQGAGSRGLGISSSPPHALAGQENTHTDKGLLVSFPLCAPRSSLSLFQLIGLLCWEGILC